MNNMKNYWDNQEEMIKKCRHNEQKRATHFTKGFELDFEFDEYFKSFTELFFEPIAKEILGRIKSPLLCKIIQTPFPSLIHPGKETTIIGQIAMVMYLLSVMECPLTATYLTFGLNPCILTSEIRKQYLKVSYKDVKKLLQELPPLLEDMTLIWIKPDIIGKPGDKRKNAIAITVYG